jgi:hypothetical protein
MLTRIVAAENVLLTIADIPLGLFAGHGARTLFHAHPRDRGLPVDVAHAAHHPVVVVAGVLVACVASQLPVLRRVRHLDVARIVRGRAS